MDNEIKELLEKLIKTHTQLTVATVKSVDRDNWVIDVVPSDGGADILDVRLRSFLSDKIKDGWVFVPSIGSSVVVGFLDAQQTYGVAIAFGEIDEMVLVMKDEIAITINNEGEVDVKAGKISIEAAELNTDAVAKHIGDKHINGDVIINNGTNGGLVKVAPLVAKLTATDAKLTQLMADMTAVFATLYGGAPPTSALPVPVPVTVLDLGNANATH